MSEHLINPPETEKPQEWANLGVALPAAVKLELVTRAKACGLKPSQYARTLLIDGMKREDSDRRAA